jgi:alanine racemase
MLEEFNDNLRVDNHFSWVEIDRSKLINNISKIKQLLGSQTHLAAMIKSNAYGHGLAAVASIIQDLPEVSWAVTYSLSEALQARAAGFKRSILVCGYADGDLREAILQQIDLVVHDQDSINRYLDAARQVGKPLYVQIKVDSGLSRLGFTPDQALKQLIDLKDSPLIVRGIFSHFSESDAQDHWYVQHQEQVFAQVVDRARQLGFHLPWIHLANTTATVRFPATHYNMVRVGGGIYGLLKNLQPELVPNGYWDLQPILSWKAQVIQVKEVPSGTYVSYGRTFQTAQTTKLAVISTGYADGYSREFSNNGLMQINGQMVPVVGRIGMNMTIVDATGVPVRPGDIAMMLGDVDGIRVADLMKRLNTISYEITNRINWTIPRRIV